MNTSTVLVPGVIATLIADGLRGDFEDEENDGWGDDVVGLIGRAHLDLFTGPLPLVGPGVRIAANTFFDDNVWNTRMPVSLYAKLVEKLAHAPSKLASGELVDVFDAIYALGAVLHVPLEGFGKLGKLTGVIGDDR